MSQPPISARPHVFYIRPAPGWLELLHHEVQSIVETPLQKYKFIPKITPLKGTVKLHRCDWRQGLEVMLRLTTAHDVEWLILESKCNQWSEVDAILERVPWDEIVADREIPIHVTTDVSQGFTQHSSKLRENFCKISGLTHVSEGGLFRFKVELKSDFLKISVSLCGEPLYKRGYKAKLQATAPLAEHQAAASIHWVMEQGVNSETVSQVFVPFAGTGTFGFESLIVFAKTGSGAFEREFSCDRFPCVSSATMGFYRKKLKERLYSALPPKIIFNEINPEACEVLKENIQKIAQQVKTVSIDLIEGDLFESSVSFAGEGKILMLFNPPYGDRLAKNSSVNQIYKKLGQWTRTQMDRYPNQIVGGCLCPDSSTWREFSKALNTQNTQTHHFTHGGKEMRLVRWSDEII